MTRSSPLLSPRVYFCVLALAAAGQGMAQESAEQATTSAVAALGRLNGVVLACKQPALTARLREILVANAPKTRAIGETFENATNASFLAQAKAVCPDGKTLVGQIDAGEAALKQALRQTP